MVTDDIKVRHTTLISIDAPLRAIEAILSKYMMYESGLYIKSRRTPYTHERDGLFLYPGMTPLDVTKELPYDGNYDIVNNVGKLIVPRYLLNNNRGMVDIKPLNPVLCINLLSRVLDYLQYEHNPYKELLYVDKISDNNMDLCLIDRETKGIGNLEDIIYLYINEISDYDAMRVNELLHKYIVNEMVRFIENYPENLYSLSVDNLNIYLNRHDDIRAIRYELVCEQCILEKELEEDFDETLDNYLEELEWAR